MHLPQGTPIATHETNGAVRFAVEILTREHRRQLLAKAGVRIEIRSYLLNDQPLLNRQVTIFREETVACTVTGPWTEAELLLDQAEHEAVERLYQVMPDFDHAGCLLALPRW